ncbi:homeobox-leucine zipper protein ANTHOCYANINLESS 2 isoform X1 [Mangifera indica]|nr:homeobox-leucine zipper protein ANTHOCYANINLESS 2 isoform X1 [Mangifera indica]XP_044467846.1 homeobox-leucine zipper protein ANTHOCYANINLESS 2 isoform X1 [Mangifera indica]XP_044467847.1 homeobox-leucine zipper protein ANTHOCYANINLESS 2 isoform X1 [Mangifera indica]
MEGVGEMDLMGEHFDPSIVGRIREAELESRSGSDNIEGAASGDDQEANEEGPLRKKKYHRHTPQQIQELEAFFKECPHPDEKQRLELSMRLNLEAKQIKFWFQNRRTQMKTQMERHENVILRQEHDKLRAENDMLKEAIKTPVCNKCGGPAEPSNASNYELQQLRIGNARLQDELGRICILANKFLGRPLASLTNPASQILKSSLELAMGRSGLGGLPNIPGSPVLTGHEFVEGSFMKPPIAGMMGNEMSYERNMLVDLALAAMDELINMAQPDGPIWVKSVDRGRDVLNREEYMRTFSSSAALKPNGFVTEASRETGIVIVNSLALVETLMDANRWVEMFPCMISGAATIDTISSGVAGTKNGALQLMLAEFQVLSPLVPVRQVKFLRFCKQHSEGLWAVVDVSINTNQDGPNGDPYSTCRRLPSGCVIQDMPNNYTKVTWIEHTEYDESNIHSLCRPLLSSGMGFGAHRWLATLQRQCEGFVILMSSTIPGQDHSGINSNGRKSMLKLAHRMTYNFCAGVCASTVRRWDKLRVGNVSEDVRVLTWKNINDPGEPPGVVLCAATSVWIPATTQRLFDFMRDERMRSEWDILSNGGPMQEMVHIANGHRRGNCVSLLRASSMNANESNMLILQETWNDASGSLIVYAPVDVPSMGMVMNGGDPACVALLPSGFAILPDGRSHGNGSNGCLLTVGYQILVNSLPTAKLTLESVETVNNLVSRTIQKIRAAIQEI